ncbi:MAG: chemotaxis protein CheW [Bdellovibrionota bacterium]
MSELREEQPLQFLIFDLAASGKLTMALNVQKVKEIVEADAMCCMPGSGGKLIGIQDLRGHPVPVVDALHLLSKGGTSSQGMRRILVCEVQNRLAGLPVARTGRITSCRASDFVPPPPGSVMEGRRIITGLIRQSKGFIPVLDLESLLEELGMISVQSDGGNSLPAGRFAGKSVLVVDDSQVILRRLTQIFNHLGMRVELAPDGVAALEHLARPGAGFDLIFTDIEMPRLDGIGLARKIRALPQWSRVPILFNSSLSNPGLIADTQNEKLGQYLVKLDEDLILRHLELLFASLEQKAAG